MHMLERSNIGHPLSVQLRLHFLHIKCGREGVRIDNDKIDWLHIQKFALYREILQP